MTIYQLFRYIDIAESKILGETFTQLPEDIQQELINEYLTELINRLSKIIVKENTNDAQRNDKTVQTQVNADHS